MGWIEVTGEQGGFEPCVSESLSAPFAAAASPLSSAQLLCCPSCSPLKDIWLWMLDAVCSG